MEFKDIDDLFKNQNFDIAEPVNGHQERFCQKIHENKISSAKRGNLRMLWSPLAAVAAGLLLIFLIAGSNFGIDFSQNSGELSNVSPEMKETQQFYTTLIKTELAKVNDAKSPETEAIVNDALVQMEKLDNEYEKLKKDLVKSGQDKRVIFAMVTNLQQRIDFLNTVLLKIEEIKELKNPNHENNYI